MRLSADENDRDFVGWGNVGRYDVLLDGKPTPHAVVASEEHGYVIVHQRDSAGDVIIDHARQEVRREPLYGKVQIIDRGPDAAIPRLKR